MSLPPFLTYRASQAGSKTKGRGPVQLATPSVTKGEGATEIAAALNVLIADAFALYVKTKNFHWHLSGPHFRDYHLMFDEQATAIYETIDTLAERCRKLGQTSIKSIGHIASLQTIDDNDKEFVSAEDMLRELAGDNEKAAVSMMAAHAVSAKYNDFATTAILEVYIDEIQRRIWFLFEASEAG